MNRRLALALRVLGLAVLFAVLEAWQGRFLVRSVPASQFWPEAILRTLPSWLILALLVPALGWIARRWRLDGPRRLAAVAVHAVAGAAFVLVHLGGSAWFAALRHHALGDFGRSLSGFLYRFAVTDWFVYWAVVGAFHLAWHERERRGREVADAALRAQLAEARLAALRAQLHPHFLFNTLNAISTLVLRGDRERTLAAIDALSDLLRAALDERRAWNSLADEMRLLERYLEIQKLRIGERLTVVVDVPEAVLPARVPALLLQPIVENAVEHGIARVPGEARLEIHARRDDLALTVEVRDRGPGFAAAAAAGGGTGAGVGLGNTRERLARIYGGRATLECLDLPEGGACVRVRLPWETAATGEPAAAGATR